MAIVTEPGNRCIRAAVGAVGLVLCCCAPARPVAAPVHASAPAGTVAAPVVPVVDAIDEPGPELAPAPAWPEFMPRLAGARVIEVARISVNVGDSPPDATYIVVRGELQASFEAWRDAAKAGGFRVLAEHASEHVRAASLIDGAGARSHLLLQRSDEGELAGMYGRGRHEPTPLRGRCVTPPMRTREFDVERSAIVHGGEFRRERGIAQVETQIGHDFDADGELDLLVPTAGRAACPRDLMWTVYLLRGGCAHAVGEVGPGELSYADAISAGTGPRPLEFSSQATELGDGGSVSTTVRTTWTFNKEKRRGRYVRTGHDRQSGVCHHCPVELCHPPSG